jgi:hypothetical protein
VFLTWGFSVVFVWLSSRVYTNCASRLLALRDLPSRLTSPIPGAWRPAQARHATPHRVEEISLIKSQWRRLPFFFLPFFLPLAFCLVMSPPSDAGASVGERVGSSS